MAYRIVPMELRHVTEATDIHMRTFPTFFLTFMGLAFLRQLYESIVADSTAFGFVCEDEQTGGVTGLVTGTLCPRGYYKRLLKKRWWAFGLASIGPVLRRPRIIPRLIRGLVFRVAPPPDKSIALLTSIAVDPAGQRRGLGARLIKAWIGEARKRGATGAYLVTDAENNDAVNAFYRKHDWKLDSGYTTHEGRKMNRYVLDF